MRAVLFIILCAFNFLFSFSQERKVIHTFYLIGDAGQHESPNPALLLLQKEIEKSNESTVVFLGDNVYPDGFHAGNETTEKKLLTQLNVLKNYSGNVFFLPGNHDWSAGKPSGLRAVKEQAEYVEKYIDNTNISNRALPNFVPVPGLPGPFSATVSDKVRIIALDLQWFLQRSPFHKVDYEKSVKETREQFYHRLDSILNLAKNNNEQVLIAAHHPMFSNGHHGRGKEPFHFLINYIPPFQILGLLGLNRLLMQDIPQPRYKKMRNRILDIMAKYENIIFAAGHEHNLQYFVSGGNYFLVSGSGSKKTRFYTKKYLSLYQNDKERGFMQCVIYNDNSFGINVFLENGIIYKIKE